MGLLKRYLRLELNSLLRNNIRFRVIGQRERLGTEVRSELEQAEARTADQHRHAVQHRPVATADGPKSSTPRAS